MQLRFGVPQAFSSAQLQTFVQKLEPFSVHNAMGLCLQGYKYEQAQAKAWLVVCAGRTEHSAIYHETLYDFALQGYNLLIYDHQGQGNSERLLPEATSVMCSTLTITSPILNSFCKLMSPTRRCLCICWHIQWAVRWRYGMRKTLRLVIKRWLWWRRCWAFNSPCLSSWF